MIGRPAERRESGRSFPRTRFDFGHARTLKKKKEQKSQETTTSTKSKESHEVGQILIKMFGAAGRGKRER